MLSCMGLYSRLLYGYTTKLEYGSCRVTILHRFYGEKAVEIPFFHKHPCSCYIAP